jgi:acetolactate synthase-1/2/3 large subunit
LGSYEDLRLKRAHYIETSPIRYIPPDDELKKAADIIKGSKRPILLCGGGIHIARAWDEVKVLRDVNGIPVIMTISGKGSVDEIHSLSLGVVGDLGGWEHAVEAVEKSDLIIVVGSKLPQYATYNWKLLENKNIIHIDIDPEELERNFPALLKLADDAKETLRKLHYLLSGWKSEDEWVRFIYRLKEQQLKEFEKINSDQPRGEAVDPRIIMVLLNKITEKMY